MTDRQKLVDLLEEWGVVYVDDGGSVTVEAKQGPKNFGYSGFFVEFDFNDEGGFEYLGVWE